MNQSNAVVADTTPLNYLIQIGQTDVLLLLFGEVMIPEAVLVELQHPKAPLKVSTWLQSLPNWLQIVKVVLVDDSIQLGKGESEAISLAIEKNVPIVLMDERRGRAAAEARGLLPIGTLNILDLADERGHLDGWVALDALRQTTFRADNQLLDRFDARMKDRRT